MLTIQILLLAAAMAAPVTHRSDVVVYGGTAGGVIAAVSAAREGLEVTLVTPDRHLGGMVSGGLGWTDYGRQSVIGGFSQGVFGGRGPEYGRESEWDLSAPPAEARFHELVTKGRHPVIPRRPRRNNCRAE